MANIILLVLSPGSDLEYNTVLDQATIISLFMRHLHLAHLFEKGKAPHYGDV
jgi:hypothetical protein